MQDSDTQITKFMVKIPKQAQKCTQIIETPLFFCQDCVDMPPQDNSALSQYNMTSPYHLAQIFQHQIINF